MDASRIQLGLMAAFFSLASLCRALAAGQAGADILLSRMGGRPEGMGEAFTAVGGDVASMLYNPAGIYGISGPATSFSHFAALDQITYENLVYGQPFSFGTMGLDLVLRNQPEIDNPLATDNPISAYDLVLALSYAQKVSNVVQNLPDILEKSVIGFNLKWVRSQLGQFSGNSGALDVGSQTDLGEGLTLGFSLLNLGPGISFISPTYADPLPTSFNAGVCKHIDLFGSDSLNVDADFQYPLYSDSSLHFGLENWIGKSLAVRVGYVLGQANSTSGLSAGLSFLLDQQTLHFGLDYAYVPIYFDGFGSMQIQNLFTMNLLF